MPTCHYLAIALTRLQRGGMTPAESRRGKGKYNTDRYHGERDACSSGYPTSRCAVEMGGKSNSRTCGGNQLTREMQQMTQKKKAGADAHAED